MKENQQIENFALISDNSDNPNQTLENINSPAQAEQVPGIKIAKIISPTNDFKYDNDDDYLFLSMFNLFFCLIIGIPAIIFSIRSRNQVKDGRFTEARKNSKIAKNLNMIGLVIGTIALIALISVNFYLSSNIFKEMNHKIHEQEIIINRLNEIYLFKNGSKVYLEKIEKI